MRSPIQNIILPSVFLSLSSLVRLSCTSGSCDICKINRYPLSFLKMHHMTSSWMRADRKNVIRVAVCLLTRMNDMDE